jgi:biopolymer transport protein ExbD
MGLRGKGSTKITECDMTPMIDMAFQLIAFFMVLMNFSGADQDEQIRLPASQLAKPPDAPLESPITLQLTKQGTVLLGGIHTPMAGLKPLLVRESQVIAATPGRSVKDATVILRADRDAKTGIVQEVIKICQETGFEKFALRAMQEERRT